MTQPLALFILNGGHEMIGKVEESADGYIVLSEPLILRPIQSGPGQYKLDFFPHSLANPDGNHKFFRSQFVSESTSIPSALATAYLERTSSIILANALDAFEKLGS